MIPMLEEILPKLTGAKYFSIVDAKCGYWNVELDERSDKFLDYIQLTVQVIRYLANAIWLGNVTRCVPGKDRPNLQRLRWNHRNC